MTDLLHRIRWTNLARVLAVLLAAVLTLALLRGKHDDPALPTTLTAVPATVAETDGSAAIDDTAAGAADPASREVEQEEREERADARRRAAAKKAAKRRALRRAAARRVEQRRRTVARKRNSGTVTRTVRPGRTPPPAPAPVGAEFRP